MPSAGDGVGLDQVGKRVPLQTCIFLGVRLAPWAGRAAELTALLPPSQPGSRLGSMQLLGL